jgi:LuxR family maltose regulon positive regulatory protein
MALVTEMRIRMWIRQENLAAAEDWAQSHLVDAIDDLDAAGEIEQIVVAQVFAAQGKYDQALNLLAQLLNAAQAARRMESVLKILTLQAVVFQTQQKIDRALSVLEQALSFAELEGYMRIFLDHGKPMEELLRSALARGITPNYVAQLLEQNELKLKPTQSLIEPLSERETEILRLIVAGLSNPEIAEELIIAESTVKTHINHIYAKLNVTSRTQSIAKARSLKLL